VIFESALLSKQAVLLEFLGGK